MPPLDAPPYYMLLGAAWAMILLCSLLTILFTIGGRIHMRRKKLKASTLPKANPLRATPIFPGVLMMRPMAALLGLMAAASPGYTIVPPSQNRASPKKKPKNKNKQRLAKASRRKNRG